MRRTAFLVAMALSLGAASLVQAGPAILKKVAPGKEVVLDEGYAYRGKTCVTMPATYADMPGLRFGTLARVPAQPMPKKAKSAWQNKCSGVALRTNRLVFRAGSRIGVEQFTFTRDYPGMPGASPKRISVRVSVEN